MALNAAFLERSCELVAQFAPSLPRALDSPDAASLDRGS